MDQVRLVRARPFVAPATLVMAVLLALCGLAGGARAASSTTVVTVTVPGATTFSGAGCQTGTADVTSLGTVLPGNTKLSGTDCTVEFGSSNDTSMLRLYQADSCMSAAHACGTAMGLTRPTPSTLNPPDQIRDGTWVNGSVGWLVGHANQVLYTNDGGLTWVPRNTGIAGSLGYVDYVSGGSGAEVLVVVGNGGYVRRSTNGGVTWAAVAGVATAQDLIQVSIEPSGVGWLVGLNSTAYKTTDGGATWTDVSAALQACSGAGITTVAVQTFSPTNAWIVGGGVDCRTTNGTTWANTTIPAGGWLRNLSSPDNGQTIWAVGEVDRVYVSTDAGATWSPNRPMGTSDVVRDVHAISDRVAWAVGYEETVGYTLDAGLTWTIVSRTVTGTTNDYYGISGVGENLWITGQNPTAANRVLSTPSAPISDYTSTGAAGDRDWASAPTTNFFGVCLRAVSQGAATDGSTWAADGDTDCADQDLDPWKAVPATAGAPAKVAYAPSADTDARAHLRFGVRMATTQSSGEYHAPLVLEVLAPSA